MSDMVERIARALWDKQYPNGTTWDGWAEYIAKNPGGFDGRDHCRELARIAIEEMRDPDEAMLQAAAYAMPGVTKEANEANEREAWRLFRTMIDAALGEPDA